MLLIVFAFLFLVIYFGLSILGFLFWVFYFGLSILGSFLPPNHASGGDMFSFQAAPSFEPAPMFEPAPTFAPLSQVLFVCPYVMTSSRHVTSRHVTSRHVASRHVTSRHRHITSCHVTYTLRHEKSPTVLRVDLCLYCFHGHTPLLSKHIQ
jgi:hypothetical protein